MANSIGDRYTCSNATCGCEIEVLRPSSIGKSEARTETGRRTAILSDLSVPPSRVNEPRINLGLEEGAGERRGDYGSPKFEEPGAFRDEEDEVVVEGGATKAGETSTRRAGLTLTCFCGNPMVLSGGQSTSARAGGS
jgi:hypothetical protein